MKTGIIFMDRHGFPMQTAVDVCVGAWQSAKSPRNKRKEGSWRFFFPASHFACSWVQTRRKQERSRITHSVVGAHTKFSLMEVLTFSEGNCCRDVLVKVNVRLLRWKVFLLSVQPGLIAFQLHASFWTLLSSLWHMAHRASPTELCTAEGLFCHKANVF